MSLLEKAENKVNDMIANRPGFKEATEKFFKAADTDGDGKVSQHEAAAQVSFIFEMIQKDLKDFGITVVSPTTEEVLGYLQAADTNKDWALDFQEFETFYLQVVKLAAARSAQGFFVKYGWSMLMGIMGVYVTKRVIRGIPVAGLIASPFLALLPSLLVGPAIGVAVRYGLDHGDLLAAKKKLFPARRDEKST